MIITGTLIDEDFLPSGQCDRAFNRITQKIKMNDNIYTYQKWYNDSYVEEYLDDEHGKNLHRQIYNPQTDSSKLQIKL